MAVVAGLWALAIAGVGIYLAVAHRRRSRVVVDGVPLTPDPRVLDRS